MEFIFFFMSVIIIFVNCDQYSTRFDNIDVDEILHSDRLLNNYFKCLMDKGPCSPDGAELKKVLPEAIRTMCVKCSDKQKEATKKIIQFLVKNKANFWKDLTEKYDPEGIYFDKYKNELEL